MSKFSSIYGACTLAVFIAIWCAVGPFTAWMFAAVACGLPQIVEAVKKK